MRIVSGIHKGRIVRAPQNFQLRPTTDIAKESLFNVLNNGWELEGIKVLDLFAGIGSISLEFASRGAGSVTAIELNPDHARFIENTAAELEMHCITVKTGDVFNLIATAGTGYNIVFADPPYSMESVAELPDVVFNSNILKENGEFILEHSADHDFSAHDRYIQTRKYGTVHFSFFE